MARACLPVKVEKEAAHRVGRIAAILEQILPVAVTVFRRVLLEGLQDIPGVPDADADLRQLGAQAVRRFAAGVHGARSAQSGVDLVERGDLFLGAQLRRVGDVVRFADNPVEQRDVGPQSGRKQPRADGEILVPPPQPRPPCSPISSGRPTSNP